MGAPAPVTATSSVLEQLPVSRWHWRLVVLGGLGTFFDLYEVFLGGVLAPVLAKEFGLGTLGKSMVIAAGFAGMFVVDEKTAAANCKFLQEIFGDVRSVEVDSPEKMKQHP